MHQLFHHTGDDSAAHPSDPSDSARGGGGTGDGRPPPRGWSVASAVCLCVAVTCLLIGQLSAAFVVATLGGVFWFLNVRDELKRAHPEIDDGAHEDAREIHED